MLVLVSKGSVYSRERERELTQWAAGKVGFRRNKWPAPRWKTRRPGCWLCRCWATADSAWI